jgi:3-dehydroquinate synthase
MKIVLTGFMGTGKTSVGRELSRRLGYPFIDTDDLIEEREGMPISMIFKEKGEPYFRRVEKEVVHEVSGMRDVVVATGGGVIKDRDNVEALRERGILIWLRTEPMVILRRVMAEGGKRPLLNVDEPLKEINRLLSEREALYRQADISVETSYITPGEAAEEIIEMLCLDSMVVDVGLRERGYKIIIGRGILKRLGLRVREFRPTKVGIISNHRIYTIHGDSLNESLRQYGIEPEVILIPDGEEYKDILWAYYLHGRLLQCRFDRGSLLIAFGGGVVGDIAGFVASTYMRGIRYIQVPTTLLAQVDSSVGGKTGVNHPMGKNMIGTFYQPSLVFIDIATLRSLPEREFLASMAEVIKYGVMADRGLFDYLRDNREDIMGFGDSLMTIIKRSCEIKADVVSRDEREAGLRAILNLGHTVGHAIETVTGYSRFLHGEAISIGMCVVSEMAAEMGMLGREEASDIKGLLQMYRLPVRLPSDIDVSEVIRAMEVDKKARAGRLRFVLPEAIGRVRIVEDVDRDVIRRALVNH